jgi:hypothetical protein
MTDPAVTGWKNMLSTELLDRCMPGPEFSLLTELTGQLC